MSESLSSSQNPLSAKLSQVLGTSYTDYGVRSALESLGEQFTQNTPTSRRQLRAAIELQDIQSSGSLLRQYEQVITVSTRVYDEQLAYLIEFRDSQSFHCQHSRHVQYDASSHASCISPNIKIAIRRRSFTVPTQSNWDKTYNTFSLSEIVHSPRTTDCHPHVANRANGRGVFSSL